MGGSDAFLKRFFGAAEAKGAKGERTAVKVKLLQPALLVSCLLWVWWNVLGLVTRAAGECKGAGAVEEDGEKGVCWGYHSLFFRSLIHLSK